MPNSGLLARAGKALLLIGKGRNVRDYRRSYQRGDQQVSHRPVEIFCEVAKCCNLSCIMCATHGSGWAGVPLMSLELARKAAPLFRHALLLHAYGFGEPLMNKELPRIVALAKRDAMAVDLFTNATLLSERRTRSLVEMGLDEMVISFSGATKQSYERVHQRAHYEVVLENLRALDRRKKATGSTTPRLALNYIAMNSSFAELPSLVELASSFGVYRIYVKPLIVYPSMPEMSGERRSYQPDRDNAVLQTARELASRRGIELCPDVYCDQPGPADVHRSQPLTREERICFQPWKTFYVMSDGNVRPCCFFWERTFMGNLDRSSAAQIWNGPGYRSLRESIGRGEYPEGCQHCREFSLRPKSDDAEPVYEKMISGSSTLEGQWRALQAGDGVGIGS